MLAAIVSTWNEEDVIAATVKHAYAQGCAAVYLLDNESTDRTVQRAVRAGAVFLGTYVSGGFDEVKKTVHINKNVVEITKSLPDRSVWWLYLDADEFPDFGTGKTIRDTLALLPEDVRAVGGHACDHVPTHEPYYVQGFHPVDFMPLGTVNRSTFWKFPLLRQDKGRAPLLAGSGAHVYHSEGSLVREADTALIIHHFPFRRPEVTRARLLALTLPDASGRRRVDPLDIRNRTMGGGLSAYHERLEKLDSVYSARRLDNLKTNGPGYDFQRTVRWYDPLKIPQSCEFPGIFEYLVWRGTTACFLGDNDTALASFRAAANLTTDAMELDLLSLGMANAAAQRDADLFSRAEDVR